MKNVTLLTIVPLKYATELMKTHRIGDFDTLPQIHPEVMQVIKSYITENIGYDKLPLASLRCEKIGSLDGVDFEEYLTVNSVESILFQLEIPEDMIASVEYCKLLECSQGMYAAMDDFDKEIVKEDLESSLFLGFKEGMKEGIISFIPFLDYDKCKFFARLSKDFKTHGQYVKGKLNNINLCTLSSFENLK